MDKKLERLRLISRYYTVDGDLMICKECKSRVIANRMLVPMKHDRDCKTSKNSDIESPWFVMALTLDQLKTDLSNEAFRKYQRKLTETEKPLG